MTTPIHHTTYPVLDVSISDYEDLLMSAERVGEEPSSEDKADMAVIKSMTEDEWRRLATCVGNCVLDGDTWNVALHWALDRVKEDRKYAEAANHEN